VFNARGLVCGCVNRARKFTPHARVGICIPRANCKHKSAMFCLMLLSLHMEMHMERDEKMLSDGGRDENINDSV
jgi:hypothetical protein